MTEPSENATVIHLYVSPTGTDDNSGLDEASPVRTIKEACQIAENLPPVDEIQIHVKAGQYAEKFLEKDEIIGVTFPDGRDKPSQAMKLDFNDAQFKDPPLEGQIGRMQGMNMRLEEHRDQSKRKPRSRLFRP